MMRIKVIMGWLSTVLALASAAALAGEPINPPDIVGMINIGQLGTSRSWTTSSLALNGNYLYCGCAPWGLKTLNVADPTNMLLTDDWGDGGSKFNGLAVNGTVLYAANWHPPEGLRVFNIADPAHPSLIRTLATTTYTWDIGLYGNLLFVTMSSGVDPPNGIAGIGIYDVTNASNPVLRSFVNSTRRLVGSAARSGNYMYMLSTNWMDVYNISNPSSPTFVRELLFNARTGTGDTRVYNGYLYVTAEDDYYPEPDWLDGGLYVFSLTDPSNPQQMGFYEQDRCADLHLQGRYGIISTGGNGVLALDVSNPLAVTGLWQVLMEWPGTGHGGYPGTAAGAGDYAFVGTSTYVPHDGCEADCCYFDCPNFGARVYAVHIQVPRPPIIAEVAPDPDSIYIGHEYSEQLTLVQGTPLPTWSVVQGQVPPGTQVDNNGLVSGWTPVSTDCGKLFTIKIKATNEDGYDNEQWQVRVNSIADFDHDDDVDQEDFGILQACFSSVGGPTPAGCDAANFDADTDIDGADLALFLPCMAGANTPPGC